MILAKKELEKYPIINGGAQGMIYQISSNKVLKLIEDMDLELLLKMKEVPLKQFVNPIEEVKENGVVYSMLYNYITTTEYKNILDLLQKYIVDNINVLLEDIYILSENRILIRDLIPKNSLCLDNKIYMLDLDLYKFANPNITKEQILKINIEKLEQYFHKFWIMALVQLGLDRTSLKYHSEYFETSYINTIKEKMNKEETIKEYIKRRIS